MSEATATPATGPKKRKKKAAAASAGAKKKRSPGIDFSQIHIVTAERPVGRGEPPRLTAVHQAVLTTLGTTESRQLSLPAGTNVAMFVREFRRVLKRNRPDVKLMSASASKGEIRLWVISAPADPSSAMPAVDPQSLATVNGAQPHHEEAVAEV